MGEETSKCQYGFYMRFFTSVINKQGKEFRQKQFLLKFSLRLKRQHMLHVAITSQNATI